MSVQSFLALVPTNTSTDTSTTLLAKSMQADPSKPPPPLQIVPGTEHADATPTEMERLSRCLVNLLLKARDTTLQKGATTIGNTSCKHYRPRRVSIRRTNLAKIKRQIIVALREDTVHADELPPKLKSKREQLLAEQQKCQLLPLSKQLRILKVKVTKEMQAIDKEHHTQRKQTHIMKRQALYDTRQKVGNQIITGQYRGRNSMALKAIQTGETTVVTSPDRIREVIQEFYTAKMIPASGTGTKTGHYQLELFTMLLEDAKLNRKDIYLLMVEYI